MVVRVATVAFEGIEARPVDVQIANGNVVFTVVGLGDKAVAESREPCETRRPFAPHTQGFGVSRCR